MSQIAQLVETLEQTPAETRSVDREELQVLTGLFQAMNAAEIRYCHWKSTHGLPKALRGGTDLDLLVDRADATRFRMMLLRREFKSFVSAPRRQFPAVEDYIGFDRPTGALVHLHVHYRLILGEQYVKNYVLPLESAFLNNTCVKLGVRIPTPELEIIVLVIRTLLKYRDRDAIRDILKVPGRSGLPEATLKEFKGLLEQTTPERIVATAKRYVDFLAPDVVLTFIETIQKSPRDGRTLLQLRQRIRELLAPYQRSSTWSNRLAYYRTMLAQELPFKRMKQLLVGDAHKKPATGGLAVAFVGADGAGKSTCVKQISRWLSWRMNVHVFYMGTTHPSHMTKIMRALANAGHVACVAVGRMVPQGNGIERVADWMDRFLVAQRLLAEGRDRYGRYLTSRRKLAQGDIVIFDRYPLEAVQMDGRAMDGARIATNDSDQGAILDNLAHSEQAIYARIRPPEHIVILHVSPEVSLARKPEHRRERIEAKSQALVNFAQDGRDVTRIDAEQPLGQVLLQIKTAVWSWI